MTRRFWSFVCAAAFLWSVSIAQADSTESRRAAAEVYVQLPGAQKMISRLLTDRSVAIRIRSRFREEPRDEFEKITVMVGEELREKQYVMEDALVEKMVKGFTQEKLEKLNAQLLSPSADSKISAQTHFYLVTYLMAPSVHKIETEIINRLKEAQ